MAPEVASVPTQPAGSLQLPVSVVSPGDVRRLQRALENLEDSLEQMRLRTRAPLAKLPRSDRTLEEFAATNRLNLLMPADRQQMAAFLKQTSASAPVLHISFAAEASRSFITEIVLWFRRNIQPDILLNVGLEPSLAAGCTLRTTNKQFDFSLRARFAEQAGLLAQKLHGSDAANAEPVAAEAAPGV